MHIDDSHFPIEYVWDGALEPPPDAQTFTTRGGDGLPRVSIGRPVWWSDQKVLGEQWVPPAGGRRYGLARFAFSLRPEGRQAVKRAEFIVYLFATGSGKRPIAFDLFPKTTTEEQTGSRTVGLDPKFKFVKAVEVSGLKAETTMDVTQAVPVITVDGIGENFARWAFESRPAHPLVGSQVVYATVELPPGAEAARASVHLSAEVTGSFGPIRGILLEKESERLSWVLE